MFDLIGGNHQASRVKFGIVRGHWRHHVENIGDKGASEIKSSYRGMRGNGIGRVCRIIY